MPVRELPSAPSMWALYPKALVGAGRSALRRLPGLRGGEPALPDVELMLTEFEIDREHLAAYDRVCGFRVRDELPPTYPHVVAFPLAMKLMTDSDFPFSVIGLVHIRNRIERLRPVHADERLSMRLRARGLAPHERGRQFEVLAEAEAGGELVWRGSSIYLHRESGGSSGKNRDGERPEPPAPDAVWKVAGDTGRRYAEVSGDRNPIHLHPLTARLFGMRRPIAHGMWLKARCLAALESLIPRRCELDVRFKLPVFLGSRVKFGSWPQDGGRAFALYDENNDKPHLTGAVTG
jgi:acyl dehydratase